MIVENYKGNKVSLRNEIERVLDPEDWDYDTAHEAHRGATTNRHVLAELLTLLVEKGTISLYDLGHVIPDLQVDACD